MYFVANGKTWRVRGLYNILLAKGMKRGQRSKIPVYIHTYEDHHKTDKLDAHLDGCKKSTDIENSSGNRVMSAILD